MGLPKQKAAPKSILRYNTPPFITKVSSRLLADNNRLLLGYY